jgi:hypothetical protein
MDGRMDDGTDGWNDASSRRPLLYVMNGCYLLFETL